MPNWIKSIVTLSYVDLISGEKTLLEIFNSVKAAKRWRGYRYTDEAIKKGVRIDVLCPIETKRVLGMADCPAPPKRDRKKKI